jgi:hypothetical protein
VDLPAARTKSITVQLTEHMQRFTISADQAPMNVVLDPDFRVLLDGRVTPR